MAKRIDISGQDFNYWHVNRYLYGSMYECTCKLCGTNHEVHSYKLRNGMSKSCTECAIKLKSVKSNSTGDFVVIQKLNNNKHLCKCNCGREFVLRNYVLDNNMVERCQICSISRDKELERNRLTILFSNVNKVRELISKIEEETGSKPTSIELAKELQISYEVLQYYIKSLSLNLYKSEISKSKQDFMEMFSSHKSNKYDIYFADKKLAINFCDTYEYSDENINKKLLQQRTLQAMNIDGVQLIHVYEHEWKNIDKRRKIINYINMKTNNTDVIRLYARNTKIITPDKNKLKKFLDENHLQGYSISTVDYALTYNNEMVAVMTFGKPRFNNNYEWELVRLAFKNGYSIVGGAEKMFKKFIDDYKPRNILSYCDITKFSGEVYNRLGFYSNENMLSEPNYVWVKPSKDGKDIVLPRYRTQKSKLVNSNLGTDNMTEDEIMKSHGYFKIYDCGNKKYHWEINQSIS